MKKYRRALALVSCLSLCSLVWCVSSAARGFPGRAGGGGEQPRSHPQISATFLVRVCAVPRMRQTACLVPGPAALCAEIFVVCFGIFRDLSGGEGRLGRGDHPSASCSVTLPLGHGGALGSVQIGGAG